MLLRFALIISCLFVLFSEAMCQGPLQQPRNPDYPGSYSQNKLVRRSSAMVTVGTGYLNANTAHIGHIGLGEISYAYALSRKLAVGAGLLGSLLCNEAYFDSKGQIVSTATDPLGEKCNRAWAIDGTIMAWGRYFPFEYLGAFGQVGLGYSLDGQAPAYSGAVGYFQPVYSQFGLVGLLRYANLLPLNNTPDFVQPTGGLRLELGIGWNL